VITKALIRASDLEIGYGASGNRYSVFRNLSLEFFGGDIIGIIGNNGVGKSTLLKTLSGLQVPLRGFIELHNKPLKHCHPDERARSMSVVLTEKISGFNLKVYDLVAMGRLPYTGFLNTLSDQDKQVIEQSLFDCGISPQQNKLLSELSDGQYQKAMIAMGLSRQAPLLLLDEPTAFLDYASKHAVFKLLRHLAVDQKKCVIVSSHDLELLFQYSDKLLLMRQDGSYSLLETKACDKQSLLNELLA